MVILLPSAAFNRGRRLIEGGIYSRAAFNRVNSLL